MIPPDSLNWYDPIAQAVVHKPFRVTEVSHFVVASQVTVTSATVVPKVAPVAAVTVPVLLFQMRLSGKVKTNLPPAGTSEVVW